MIQYLGKSRSFQSIRSVMLVRSACVIMAFNCASKSVRFVGKQFAKACATYSLVVMKRNSVV